MVDTPAEFACRGRLVGMWEKRSWGGAGREEETGHYQQFVRQNYAIAWQNGLHPALLLQT